MLTMRTGLYAPRVPYVDAIVRRCEFQFFRFSTALKFQLRCRDAQPNGEETMKKRTPSASLASAVDSAPPPYP